MLMAVSKASAEHASCSGNNGQVLAHHGERHGDV
jgi:hypothetical protein